MNYLIVQFHEDQMDILMVVIFMPMTDLSTGGLVLTMLYGLLTSFVLVPYNFLDIFLLFYDKIDRSEDQL